MLGMSILFQVFMYMHSQIFSIIKHEISSSFILICNLLFVFRLVPVTKYVFEKCNDKRVHFSHSAFMQTAKFVIDKTVKSVHTFVV